MLESAVSTSRDVSADDRRPIIGVVIPAYMVERNIQGVLKEIPPFVSRVIVVDDASTDDTARLVAEVRDPRVCLLRHERNGGVGAAVRTGYRRALEDGTDIIVKLDGDGQMNPSDIKRVIGPIIRGQADYTKGNRFLHTRQLSSMPLGRRVGNMGLSFLAKASSGYWDVFDPTNGFTAIHRRVLGELDLENIDERWFFETSMLIELGLIGAVVRDVYLPARYGTERSSLSVRRVLFEFPPRLLGAMLRRIWLRYFVRDFSALGLFIVAGMSLAVFGFVWGISHWILSEQTGREQSTGTVMLAVLPLILGMQLLLQAIVIDMQNTPRVPLAQS